MFEVLKGVHGCKKHAHKLCSDFVKEKSWNRTRNEPVERNMFEICLNNLLDVSIARAYLKYLFLTTTMYWKFCVVFNSYLKTSMETMFSVFAAGNSCT